MGSRRWNSRVRKLHKMTGKAHPWCQTYLQDFGQFNRVISEALFISISLVDRNVALRLDKARLDAADASCDVTVEDLERGL